LRMTPPPPLANTLTIPHPHPSVLASCFPGTDPAAFSAASFLGWWQVQDGGACLTPNPYTGACSCAAGTAVTWTGRVIAPTSPDGTSGVVGSNLNVCLGPGRAVGVFQVRPRETACMLGRRACVHVRLCEFVSVGLGVDARVCMRLGWGLSVRVEMLVDADGNVCACAWAYGRYRQIQLPTSTVAFL
jgi:hypothetical protein